MTVDVLSNNPMRPLRGRSCFQLSKKEPLFNAVLKTQEGGRFAALLIPSSPIYVKEGGRFAAVVVLELL